jgi:hypothetical protein
MGWRLGGKAARGRVAGAVAALVLVAPGGAHAEAVPTFRATTTIGTTVLPVRVADGAWTVDARSTRASLHIEMANPAPAVTTVEAGWVSPFVRSRGRCFGQYDFYYVNHRIVLPTPHVTDRVRYREQGGRWSRWRAEYDQDYQDTDPDMTVGAGQTDDCVFILPRVPRRPVQLEIRHTGVYGGTHRITEDLVVKVP